MPWAREQLGRSSGFDDATGVHHKHAVGETGDHGEVVADVHGTDVVIGAELLHRPEDVCLGRNVEPGRRLVEDDRSRAQQERHRDADALLLTSRDLVRVPAQEGRSLRGA